MATSAFPTPVKTEWRKAPARSRRLGPVSPLVMVHAILATAWLLLFVTQSTLIATRRVALHRRLSGVTIALALVMLPIGYITVIEQTRRGFDLSGDLNIRADPLGEAIFPPGTLGGMMPAALGHFVGHDLRTTPALFLPMLLVAFLGPAAYDRIRFKRFNRVTLWGGILLFAWGNIRAVLIRPTDGWHQFMGWLAS